LVDVSAFHLVSAAPRIVLAGRAEVGVAWGFGRDVTVLDANGQPLTQHVADLPASQRFFAGGSTTVRGFNVDQLGTPAVLDKNGLSNGGNGVIILNGEVRTTVAHDFLKRGGDLGVVGFVDAGNVFAKAGDLSLNQLLGTVGFGVRWKSPIGPVRLDIGFKVNPRLIAGVPESRTGWHFSIGEAF
jgi:outer membrane translocation and assembly module TamA